MNHNPILSLCIPTNGIAKWVLPLVESIYEQGVDNNLFEVVVTNNGEDNGLSNSLNNFNQPNLHYYKTSAIGFTNQIESFKKASGLFCKMLNHRSILLNGSIENLISIITRYKKTQPIIYCAERFSKGEKNYAPMIECENINSFIANLGCLVSWSAGVGIWKEDITKLDNCKINPLFPHMALLLEIREDSQYVIWDVKYEKQSKEEGKGGYNPFFAFGVEFLDIINFLRIESKITEKTFVKLKESIYIRLKYFYLEDVLLNLSHNHYDMTNIKEHMMVYYDKFTYYKMVFLSWIEYPKYKLVHFFDKK